MLIHPESPMRCDEMIALEWADVDLGNRQLCIRRSDWNGQVTTPKGGRTRHVPMTKRLTERSIKPGRKLAVRQGFEFYERPHLTC